VTIRVVIADDQPLLRTGFKALIDPAPGLEVVGEAGDGREAVRLAKAAQADVVLMDIRMPLLDGLAATRLITHDEDLAGVKVLILTTFEIDEYVFEALRAGASGFLGKSVEADELLQAIRTVSRGDALLSPTATRTLISQFLATPAAPKPADETILRGLEALTEREREITAGGDRPVQRRDRRAARAQPRYRQDTCQPRYGQSRRPRPRPAGRLRLPQRPRRIGAGRVPLQNVVTWPDLRLRWLAYAAR
jgi:DNA-binding NarL/FixJ family response regulator